MKNEVTVATPRQEVLEHRAKMQVVTDLMGGQDAMQAAGERYIRKRQGEPQGKWQDRVNGATLLNAYERTLAYLAGQVFAKDATLEDEDKADPAFAEFVENVDGQGNNLTVFAKRFFAHSINDGYGVVLVDSAAIQTRETTEGRQYLSKDDVWLPLTAADADMLGLRPRMIEVRAENVLGWRYEITGSRTRLVMLRLLESYQEPGTWDAEDVTRQQVRVLTPGTWQVWRKPVEDKDQWELYQDGTLPGQEIPVALFRPGKPTGEMTCAPALESLAKKNVEHWQKYADHNNLMSWVRYPGMFGSGFTQRGPDDGDLRWGPGELTVDNNPDAKMESIGVDAPSVAASMAELEVIESQMALFGLQMLMPQTGNVTATEKALSAGESDSTLKGWASELKDCLEQAFTFVAEYMGMDGEAAPGLFINTDFHALSGMDDATLNALNVACNNGNLPREVLWSEFRRCGVIADDWTPEVIADLLLREARDGMFAGPTASLLANKAPGQAQSSVGSQASDAA